MPPIPSDERKRQRTFYNLKLAKSSTSTRCSLFTKNGSNTTGCDVGNPLCTKCQTKKVPRESRETMEEREKVTSEEKFSVVLFSILIEVPNCSIRYSRETVSFIIVVSLSVKWEQGEQRSRGEQKEKGEGEAGKAHVETRSCGFPFLPLERQKEQWNSALRMPSCGSFMRKRDANAQFQYRLIREEP